MFAILKIDKSDETGEMLYKFTVTAIYVDVRTPDELGVIDQDAETTEAQ